MRPFVHTDRAQLTTLLAHRVVGSWDEVRHECDRLHAIRSVMVDNPDWGEITMNRLRQWAAIVRRLSAQTLRRYGTAKRYTHLLAYPIVRAEERANGIVGMFHVLVGRVFAQSDRQVGQTKGALLFT